MNIPNLGAGVTLSNISYITAPALRSVCWLFITGALVVLTIIGAHALLVPSFDREGPALSTEALLDPSGSLTIDAVRSTEVQPRFQPVPGNSINSGYNRGAVWLRLRLSSTESDEALLSLTPNFTDLLDIYVVPANGGGAAPAYYAMGDHRPLPEDALSGLGYVVPVELSAGAPTEVFVRAQAVNSVLTVQASLYSPAEHTYRTTVSGLAFGGWFGAMAILVVIQLVFFYYNRLPAFAFLAAATFVAMLVYFGTLGFSRIFLFSHGGEGNDLFTAVTSWFGITTSAVAARMFLDSATKAPWVDAILKAGALVGVAGVVAALTGYNMEFGPVAQGAIIIVATVCAFQSLRAIDRADASTRLLAAAFLALWAGIFATILQRSGLMSLRDWVAHGYAVGTVIYSVLLTGSLAVRLRISELASARMRNEALALARDSERRANSLVEERTRDLAAAKQVAEEALAAELAIKEQQVRFMEVISHQYRTPLAAVQTHISNIGMALSKDERENHRRLDRVRKGIARLVEVLEVNLSRSRLQGSAFEPYFVARSAGELVEAAVARARDLVQIGMACTIAPDARHVRVAVDADMLEIAIINVLENAAKFSDPGAEERISVHAGKENGALVIEIRDRGKGIPHDELPRLLERNFRASNAVNVPGTGNGLSLVARIMAAHQGTIEIDSALGVGTTVRLVLPLAGGASPAIKTA